MTTMDGIFVALAILDLIFIIAMGFAVSAMVRTTLKGAEKAGPALRELKAIQETTTALATHLKTDGLASMRRVQAVVTVVKQRVATTRRILREIRPQAEETALRVRETSADLSQKANAVGDIAQRISRLKTAVAAANQAARERP